MRAYLPRFAVRTPAANLAQFQRDVDKAAQAGCQLAVFPEQFITGYRTECDPTLVRQEFRAASVRHPGLLLCCGTITEDGQNRQYWLQAGREVVCYAKVHLFRPNGEREMWQPGNAYHALQAGGWQFGLGTCNDVRFPEQMHALSRRGKLHCLVYPALWPIERDHIWAALLRARAIEHGAFCLGCCVAAVDNNLEEFVGAENHVFDPLGNELRPGDNCYELEMALLDTVLVDTAAEYIAVETTRVDVVGTVAGVESA